MADAWDLVVRTDDLRTTNVLEAPKPGDVELGPGQVLVAIDHFSLTANNVTYGALGDELDYWRFYPAPEPWGRIPAWGYAEVVASRDAEVTPGARIFGYLPMSTHAVLTSGGVHAGGFVDVGEHRRPLPPVYNRYRITRAGNDRDREQRVALFTPLYGTSWLLADWLVEQDFAGAFQLVASAASSKTALGLGHALQRDFGSPLTTIGLTSSRHRAFTENTGHWDAVLTYDEVESLDPTVPAVYTDFSGNADVAQRVSDRLGGSLVRSVPVGIADWKAAIARPDSPFRSEEPQFFFAPTRVEKRNADWGPAGLAHRLSSSQDRFIERSREWLTIRSGSGPDAIREALLALLDGAVPPDVGLDLTP